MKIRQMAACLLAAALALLPHSATAAQIFERTFPDQSLEYDPSVRSTAMGGASGAMFWVTDPNHWANPALLGYTRGIRYDDAQQSYPSFDLGGGASAGLRLTARREAIGYGGLGVALAGRPFDGPGGVRYEATFSDLLGPPIQNLDQTRSWSLGISTSRVMESLSAWHGRKAPGITRYLDLALGYSRKTTELSGLYDVHAVTWDWGALASVGAPFTVRRVPMRIEGAYGYSVLNAHQAEIYPYAAQRHERNSLALHATAGSMKKTRLPEWLRAGLDPFLSIGAARDQERLSLLGSPDHDEREWGGEVGIANVLFVRFGSHGTDLLTSGYGIALPVGKFGGLRYDHAHIGSPSVPGSFSVSEIKYRAWSVWIDPLALRRARQP